MCVLAGSISSIFLYKKVVDKFFTRASIFLFLAIIQARTGFSTLTSVSFFLLLIINITNELQSVVRHVV
jgi:hypothetical protein